MRQANRVARLGIGVVLVVAGLSGGAASAQTTEPIVAVPIDGVVDHVSPSFLGVRTDDALYRFIRGYEGTVMVGHHLFADGVNEQAAAAGWRAWITRLFGR